MPRYEYSDHEGAAHVVLALSQDGAAGTAFDREYYRTGSLDLAEKASATVQESAYSVTNVLLAASTAASRRPKGA